jgi:hypothetical protein
MPRLKRAASEAQGVIITPLDLYNNINITFVRAPLQETRSGVECERRSPVSGRRAFDAPRGLGASSEGRHMFQRKYYNGAKRRLIKYRRRFDGHSSDTAD